MNKFYTRVLYVVSKLFYTVSFRGSTRVLQFIFKLLPLRKIELKHPLGFLWYLDSREALWTYISSCERFTSRVIADSSNNLKLAICIGANRGWYPLVINALQPKIRLVAFEPNSLTYKLLQQNIERNHATMQLYKFAIGDLHEIRDIYGYPSANDGMTTLYPTNSFSTDFEKLEGTRVETLDSIIQSAETGSQSTLLQMDIEGGEYAALQGAREFLKNNSPIVICEINPVLLAAAGSTSSKLFQYMTSLGYEIYWIDERGFLHSQKAHEPCKHLELLPSGSGSNYIFLKDSHHLNSKWKVRS